jgi:protein-S-isoprenylcysteine O-methyltransferase Ste14
MLWVRGLIFTVAVPGVVGGYIPLALDPAARPAGGIWDAGWIMIVAGTLIYLLCLLRFLAAGGTPAVFFTRPLRHLIGEEPDSLVSEGLYRYSRNPMYVGVLLVIFGQAVVRASPRLATYGLLVFVIFHLVVVLLEEPHLLGARGPIYETYCRVVPRLAGPEKS